MKRTLFDCYRIMLLVWMLCVGPSMRLWAQVDQSGPLNDLPTETELAAIIEGYGKVPEKDWSNYTTKNWTIQKLQPENNYWVMDVFWYVGDSAWPKEIYGSPANTPNVSLQADTTQITGHSSEIIYAYPGETKTIRFQTGNNPDNLDGFIHWYVKEHQTQRVGTLQWDGEVTDLKEAYTFANGLAWLRGQKGLRLKLCLKYSRGRWFPYTEKYKHSEYHPDPLWKECFSPQYAGGVKYTAPQTPGTYYVVFDASPRNDARSGQSQTRVQVPPIALRAVYEVRVINHPDGRFSQVRANHSQIYDASGNLTLKARSNPDAYFLEGCDIYTPRKNNTNFRLAEPLSNYIMPGNVIPDQVDWKVYDEAGNHLPKVEVLRSGPIAKISLPYDPNSEKVETFYLVTTVSKQGTHHAYPLSMLKVINLPYLEPLTQKELEAKVNDPHYQCRMKSYLKDNNYVEVDTITFDYLHSHNYPVNVHALTAQNNFARVAPMRSRLDPYYSFADLNGTALEHRKNNRLHVGRGEYGLYRTFNVPGVSENAAYTIDGVEGRYDNYFAKTIGLENYKKQVYDRLYETSGGQQAGFFMYIDATDHPGVITRIHLKEMCPNTNLIATAWVCNLKHPKDLVNADIGFTLKRVNNQTGEEEMVSKFYSGVVKNASDTEPGKAEWKQIFFQYSFSGTAGSGESYVLEVANNTPNSNGADYAIDDIKIYRSTPNIKVDRLDDCNASILAIYSPYKTILDNMGWREGGAVSVDPNKMATDLHYRKFRYGLMGDRTLNEAVSYYVGSIYVAFLDMTIPDRQSQWITISKEAEAKKLWAAAKALRFVVSTDMNGQYNATPVPDTQQKAEMVEHLLNIRAIKDYNFDVPWWQRQEPQGGHSLIPIETFYDGKNITDMGKYQQALTVLYERLKMPRIQIPWTFISKYGEKFLVLDKLDVRNTDLRYIGQPKYEVIGDQLIQTGTHTGRYQVMMMNAAQVAAYHSNPNQVTPASPTDKCALLSEFTVYPSTTVLIEAVAHSNVALCVGGLRRIKASLNAYRNRTSMEQVRLPDDAYLFDWFLGTKADYDSITNQVLGGQTLKHYVEQIRKSLGVDWNQPLTVQMVKRWNGLSPTSQVAATEIISLLNRKLLLTGTAPNVPFDLIVNGNQIVAMPFVSGTIGGNFVYCTEETPVDLPVSGNHIPEMHAGFTGVVYPFQEEVTLRLGKRHLTRLTIPINRDKLVMAAQSTHLGILPSPVKTEISLKGNTIETVGEVLALNIPKEGGDVATVTLQFDERARQRMQEGGSYELLIPFVQYSGQTLLSSECDGLASLPVKVVPEFLTWRGTAADAWYNDSHWMQSTEAELYKGAMGHVDANGTDDVNQALAPLYFTKITLPNGQTLALEEIQPVNQILPLDAARASQHIQYDMAVDTVKQPVAGQSPYAIVPYYINKVSEIYFKPQARLQRQHHLTYDTARVEFEMKKERKYWMASPLQDVYAGDMYAPKQTALQHTYAFDPIHYSGGAAGVNDRQNPAFYQKAWDKAVDIYTDAPGTAAQEYKVVQSNWSVEYNDVNVPYTLGKGFSISVEDFTNGSQTALVRLPKADKSYTYEPLTRAMSSLAQKSHSGRLADGSPIEVILTDEDQKAQWGAEKNIADGDGTHFLLGNPYMYPLDIRKFLDANPVLAKKFWTLSADGTATVGTPDLVDAQGQWAAGSTATEIAPMQAFFVELVKPLDATTTQQTVKFTTDMMAGEPTQTVTTRAAVQARHPLLRFTAEKGGMRSVAYLTVRDDARTAYEKEKDAVTLLDNELTDIPQVYTVAGDRAVGVNAVNRIDNIPLGLFAAEGDEVTLTLEGLSSLLGSVTLYDAETNQEKLLAGDSYTIDLTGASHGRYFLRSDASPTANEQMAAEAVSIYSVAPGQVTISATAPLEQVQLFRVDGRLLHSVAPRQMAITLPVPSGTVCLVRAVTAQTTRSLKLQVR